MSPCNDRGCFVPVHSVASFFRFVRSRHFSGIVVNRIKCTSAPVSTRLVAVCTKAIVGS